MKYLYTKYREWLNFSPIDDKSLSIFRIIYASFCLLGLNTFGRYDWIGQFPIFFYNPVPSFATLFSDFPSTYVFHIFNCILPLFTVLLLVGYKTKIVSILYGISTIIIASFVFSITNSISHIHLIPFTAIIFAFSNWGNYYSLDAILAEIKNKSLKKNYNVIPFFSLIIAFSFFTSGFDKLINGWLDVDFQATQFYFSNQHIANQFDNKLLDSILNLKFLSFLWEIVDYTTVFLELLPLFFLFNKSVFRVLLFCIATFHVLVLLLMDISFSFYPILYAPFIVNWNSSVVVSYSHKYFTKFFHNIAFHKIIFFSFLVYFTYCFIIYTSFFAVSLWAKYSLPYMMYLSYSILLLLLIKNKKV